MAAIMFKGETVHTSGDLPKTGGKAPDFRLTDGRLSDMRLDSFKGKKKILNIVPSLDTGVCSASAKTFNARAHEIPDTQIITISNDLPFAQNRFLDHENIQSIQLLSQLRDRSFGHSYGVEITDGPMAGLLARAVVVLDSDDRVVYTQLVEDIGKEPDYTSAIDAARRAL